MPRLFFIFYSPAGGGDWDIYSIVAENILSGCGVSLSSPESGECAPHFGGNQGPGYPVFVALIWWLGGHSDVVVRVVQAIIGVVAIIYLVKAILLYSSSFKVAVVAGLILALSPLEMAWPRYLQTETLSLAGTLWIFSELLISLHKFKIRVFSLSIALIITTFIRLDAILLVVPIAVTAFMIHKPFKAIKKGLIIAILLSLPWSAWLVRNYMVGMVNILPMPMTSPNNVEPPIGYLKWLWTWTTHEYQRPGTLFPVTRFEYNAIEVDPAMFSIPNEEKKVKKLLDELKQHAGKPFPKHIDDKFNELALYRINNFPLDVYIINPLKRIESLWSNIYNSFGWPTELPSEVSAQERLEVARGGIDVKFKLALKYPTIAIGKFFVSVWRVVLLGLFVFLLIYVFVNKKSQQNKNLMLISFSFIIARSVFSGWGNYIETRYTLMQMPIIEVAFIITLYYIIKARRSSKA